MAVDVLVDVADSQSALIFLPISNSVLIRHPSRRTVVIRVRPLAYLKRDRSVEMPLVVSVDPHPTHPRE